MIKIVRIPEKLKHFFTPSLKEGFNEKAWKHFRVTVLALIIAFGRKNISRLDKIIVGGAHRTKLNDFFIASPWNCEKVLREIAYRELLSLIKIKPGQPIYLIVDDSRNKKRGKHMDAVGKFKDPLTGFYLLGHNYVAVTILYDGKVIPFAVRLYKKKEQCKKGEFRKLTQFAAEIIESFQPPEGMEVIVLFDAYYMCKTVTRSIKKKRFNFVSVLKSNRNIMVTRDKKSKVRIYSRTCLRKRYDKISIRTKNKKKRYHAASAYVFLPSVGQVKVTFSKKPREKKVLAIVTDNLDLKTKDIIQIYSYRWSIEVFFKETKQYLGLGDYQTGDYNGVVRHLHLVFIAYALLTHLRIQEDAQGEEEREKKLVFLSTQALQHHIRNIVYDDMIDYLYETVKDRKMVKPLSNLLKAA